MNADVYTDMLMPTEIPYDSTGHLVLVPTPAHKGSGDFDLIASRPNLDFLDSVEDAL